MNTTMIVSNCPENDLVTASSVSAEPPKVKACTVPYNHLIFNPQKDLKKVVEHCKAVYDAVYFISGLSHSVRKLIDFKTSGKTLMLQGTNHKNKFKKTLFVDLDETLVHTSFVESQDFSTSLEIDSRTVWFNVRPHAFEFLKNMGRHYEIVLFTAAEKSYAEAFVEYFNMHTDGAISSLLSREHCIHIYKGVYFKDLRIVMNRNIKDMVLLDNSAHCFGNLLNNGVPISSFTKDSNDYELMFIENYLERLAAVDDVREHNRNELRLCEILEVKTVQI